MSIIWCGGEDIDFPNGAVTVSTNASHFRAGYARCAIRGNGVHIRSTDFSGGGVTSAWLSAYVFPDHLGNNSDKLYIGLIKDSTSNAGIWIGSLSANNSTPKLFKYDGSTRTTLESAPADSFPTDTLRRIDLHLVSYGVSSTINVYIDGVLAISFSGDCSIAGVSSLSAVGIGPGVNPYLYPFCSGIIVADEDTRALQLTTLAPSGDGTANQWTGAVGDINETTINDATAVCTDTIDQDEQYNIADLPAGIFTVRAVRVAARVSSTVGAVATKIGLGVKNGVNVNYDTPTAPGTSWVTRERLMTQDPTTSADWALADMNGLQVEFRSGA